LTELAYIFKISKVKHNIQSNTTDCMNDTLNLHMEFNIMMYGVLRRLLVDISIEIFPFQNMS